MDKAIPSLSKLSISSPYPSPLRGHGDSKSAQKFFEALQQRKMRSIQKRDREHPVLRELDPQMDRRLENAHQKRMDNLNMQVESFQSPFPQTLYLGTGTWPSYSFELLRTDVLIPSDAPKTTIRLDNRLVIWSSRNFETEDSRTSQWYTACIGNEDCGYINEWYYSLREIFSDVQRLGRINTGELFISMKAFIGMHWSDLYWIKKQSTVRSIYIVDYASTTRSSNRWFRYAMAERKIRQYDSPLEAERALDAVPSSNASTTSTETL